MHGVELPKMYPCYDTKVGALTVKSNIFHTDLYSFQITIPEIKDHGHQGAISTVHYQSAEIR